MTPIPRRLSPSAVKPKNIQAGAVTAIAIAPGSITNDALAVGAGGASTAYSGTAPSSPSVGDVWFDSSDSLKLKRWDGTAWVSMQDLGIAAAAAGAAAAATAATAAQTTADGKNKVYRQDEPPPGTAYAEGDLWFDTNDNNKIYRRTSSAWTAVQLGGEALANINANKITAGSIDASVITVSNLNAGNITTGTIAADRITSTSISAANITAAQITSGTISSARITSASISAADINADRITAGTITGRAIVGGTFTTGTWSAGLGTGLKIDSDGYITGSGAGVKIRDYGTNGTDGATGTVLFGNIIGTGRLDADRVLLGDGTSSIELLRSLVNFKRYTDDTGGVVNIYRRSWTGDGDDNNGTSLADYAALIAFYKEGATSATSAIRWRSYTSGTIPTTGPGQVVLDNFQTNIWSDARLKQEVFTPESALEIVKKLNPKSFSWKNDSTSTPYYGMFAQEMHEVLPNLVTVGSAGNAAPIDNKTGEHVPEDVWSVDYVSLVPYLIGAVKELSAKVAELEAKK
jgi:hypothetical protein